MSIRWRYTALVALLTILTLLVSLGPSAVSASLVASSPPTVRAAFELNIQPGTLALEIRSSLYDAQQNLLLDDTAAAKSDLDRVTPGIETFTAALGDDPASAATIRQNAEAAKAGAANDQVGLAAARGHIWTAMLGGAYNEAVASARNYDSASVAAWLLLREFRPTTRFSRPGASATLAVKKLVLGTMTPEAAVAAIDADLLDTYQSKLDAELAVFKSASAQGLDVRQAESAAMVQGYWAIVEPAYERQAGQPARQQADATVASLSTAVTSGNATTTDGSLTSITALSRSFRAVPLSEEDKARRAGQLMRYLSLVPVEYGRGVKNGTVIFDIEIQEAQAFLDGARASFDDLHLTLEQKDAAATDQIEVVLDTLEKQLHDAAQHTGVVGNDVIQSQIDGIRGQLTAMLPEEWTRSGGDADFDVIGSVLDQLEAAVVAGKWDQAESARLEAYAIYEVGAEKRLLAFAPELAIRTEQLFWQGTSSTPGLAVALQNHASIDKIRQTRVELDKALAEGQERLGVGRPAKAVVIFNAATIVFREGLEAVLILASLIASMIGANQRFKKPLALGAMAALLATAGLFVLAQTVLSSLARYEEKLEAVVSLIAIAVLLIIMNWFFHKVYWTKWISKQHTRRRLLIGGAAGQVLGLVILGFTSVFREGAESVLFLQALVLDAGAWVVIQGTLLGLAATGVVGVLVFALQKKLPHKRMLMVTGGLIALVLVVMIGNTVHVMQIVGWMPITAVPGLTVPYWMGQWFGVYSIWESLIAQAIALIVVLGSYFGSEFVVKREQKRLVAIARAEQQGHSSTGGPLIAPPAR